MNHEQTVLENHIHEWVAHTCETDSIELSDMINRRKFHWKQVTCMYKKHNITSTRKIEPLKHSEDAHINRNYVKLLMHVKPADKKPRNWSYLE